MNFHAVYKEFYPGIVRYLARIVNDYDLAEDFTQDVFIRVNEGLDKFEGRSELSTWIYKIATNIANDYFRSSSFQKGTRLKLDGTFLEENKKDQSAISDEILEKEEMNSCIKRYVQELSDNYRTIFVLSEYEELKNKEIADILDLSLDTVKIRLYRARTQLRKKMEAGCLITFEGNTITCDEK